MIKLINKIIICSNIPGAGKDTVRKYLENQYGFKGLAFADPIYKIAKEIFEMKQKSRKLLQDIGEKMREIDENVWVDYTFKKAKHFDKVVISDLRRKNEYNKAIQEGFLPIRIVCERNIAIERIIKRDGQCDISLLDNKSEIETRSIPMIEILNNADFQTLYQTIELKLFNGGVESVMY